MAFEDAHVVNGTDLVACVVAATDEQSRRGPELTGTLNN